MPYTLAKFFLWGLLMALAGGIVGWLLRSLKCRAEVARARAVTVDEGELDRLRGRVANLEPLVGERDRLRMELADVRGSSAGALGFSAVSEPLNIPDQNTDESTGATPPIDSGAEPGVDSGAVDQGAGIAALADTGTDASETETTPETAQAPEPDPEPASEPDPEPEPAPESAPEPDPAPESAPEPEPEATNEVDVSGATAVLGKKIKLDDLTVVEGVGPKIAELCSGIGLTTWNDLAGADVADLQSMLDAAGSRFQMHKPASWPQQAALLAGGKWAEFKELTDALDGGK